MARTWCELSLASVLSLAVLPLQVYSHPSMAARGQMPDARAMEKVHEIVVPEPPMNAEGVPIEAFECDPKFESVMTPGWVAWCCLNHLVACSPTTTTITTTTTLSPEQACKQDCVVDGLAVTCAERLLWAAEDASRSVKHSCAAGLSLVSVECGDVCNRCTPEVAGCRDGETVPIFFKKFAMVSASFAAGHANLATGSLAFVSFALSGVAIAFVAKKAHAALGARTFHIESERLMTLVEGVGEA